MSLFGAPKPAASAPSFGGSLFSGSTAVGSPSAPAALGGSTTPAASTARPSAFGGSVWDNKPLGASTTQAAGGFGASTATAVASSNNNINSGSLAGSINNAARPTTGAYFDSLLAKSKKRTDGEADSIADGSSSDLPSLHLGLGDLRQKLRKLGPRGAPGAPGAVGGAAPLQDGKAHYVLAASGVDPGAAVRDLGNFGIFSASRSTVAAGGAASIAPGTGGQSGVGAGFARGASEVDVDTYLTNLQTKTTLSMIADGLERSVRDFDSFLEDNVTSEWEAQRKRIYEHFGIKTRDDVVPGTSGTPRYGTPDIVGGPGASTGGFGRRRSRQQQQATQPSKAGTTGGAGSSVFGRSRMNKSVIGSASRIGAHASEFSDVETANASNNAASGGAGASGPGSLDDRYTREKQGRLAETVHRLNDSRIESAPFPILSEMVAVEASIGGDRQAALVIEAFRALSQIVGEDPESVNQPHLTRGAPGPRPRTFARAYLDPNPNSAGAVSIRQRILSGANRFLETKFFQELEGQIAKFPQEASLGGRPDVVSKIKAYIRVRAAQKMLVPDNVDLQQVQGEYVWAVIFYLLRSGHVTEAAQYVNDNQTQIRGIDRVFASYINSYASSEDRRLKRPMQERCNSDYNQRARNAPEGSVDPFRMACYKVIGRCDIGNRNLDNLQTDVHDWIWLQFNLAREGDRISELANETYGLAELQETIREIGQKHFAKNAPGVAGGPYAMYFYLQVLAGLFEPAIAYLYSFSYIDAVHFAVALEYYGLLRTPDASLAAANELLSHSTRGQPQINFARMIGYYTRDFRAANVSAAVDYLILICLGDDDVNDKAPASSSSQQAAKSKEQSAASALCYEALRELVLETREFSKLIGDIRPDGTRIRGLIEERGTLIALDREQDFVKAITLQAARDADDGGRTTDAVLLYHLAGDYDTVVVIVSRALSEAIALEIGEEPMRLVPVKPRVDKDKSASSTTAASTPASQQPGSSLSLASIDDPIELARTMMTMYERDNMFRRRIREETRIACGVLLQMSEIKGLVEARKWPQCLDKIRDLGILPLQAGGDPGIIRSFAARFSSLAQPVAINVPNLLMWTILCCTQQRERLLGGQFSGNESASRRLADDLKQICVDLTAYTSQLRYRFPPYLHEALARASAD
ncbi:nuclear pore complex protein Nup93 [Sporothrix schenckii 1099-18]|uniref:Nuclear pore complex protein Nup93 n=1 Tax=Sporothrix schenckii 1099-18 TaxID=1397361 RepID=A0A0F2M787_SPOSC|nr:nuclear pore complex protein Nup93 [Sporothrix schenckii 1099-18]KJR85553.1 nuclear pore complex protein Nup93 [Sporothrix schenckii 1099-18]